MHRRGGAAVGNAALCGARAVQDPRQVAHICGHLLAVSVGANSLNYARRKVEVKNERMF